MRYPHLNDFQVKTKDRLTGEERSHSVSQNGQIRTQVQAEVHVATSPTPFGGDHPGFDIIPEDPKVFDDAIDEWLESAPDYQKERYLRNEKEAEELKADQQRVSDRIANARKMKELEDAQRAAIAAGQPVPQPR